ncbi:MAG: hypothetical protein ACTSPY_17535 [Candidatus Helarchaeota archaeon]
MTFYMNSAKQLLEEYSKELAFEESRTGALESKANTQMQITGVILGLYGTMSTIFFVTYDTVTGANPIFSYLYVGSAIATVIFMFLSLISAIYTLRVRKWLRPLFYQEYSKEKKEGYSKTVTNVLGKCFKKEEDLIKEILKNIATTLTVYYENNNLIAKRIRWGFYFIIGGILCFIISIIILIGIGTALI